MNLQEKNSGEKPSMADVMKQLLDDAKDKKPTLNEKMNNAKDKVRKADAEKLDSGNKSKTKRDERM